MNLENESKFIFEKRRGLLSREKSAFLLRLRLKILLFVKFICEIVLFETSSTEDLLILCLVFIGFMDRGVIANNFNCLFGLCRQALSQLNIHIFSLVKSELNVVLDAIVLDYLLDGKLRASAVEHRKSQPHLKGYFWVLWVVDRFWVIIFHPQVIVYFHRRWIPPLRVIFLGLVVKVGFPLVQPWFVNEYLSLLYWKVVHVLHDWLLSCFQLIQGLQTPHTKLALRSWFLDFLLIYFPTTKRVNQKIVNLHWNVTYFIAFRHLFNSDVLFPMMAYVRIEQGRELEVLWKVNLIQVR